LFLGGLQGKILFRCPHMGYFCRFSGFGQEFPAMLPSARRPTS
jgi:hypothetical protein